MTFTKSGNGLIDGQVAALRAVLEDVQSTRHTSFGAISDELNRRGILTRRGGRWHKSTVMNLLRRLEPVESVAAAQR